MRQPGGGKIRKRMSLRNSFLHSSSVSLSERILILRCRDSRRTTFASSSKALEYARRYSDFSKSDRERTLVSGLGIPLYKRNHVLSLYRGEQKYLFLTLLHHTNSFLIWHFFATLTPNPGSPATQVLYVSTVSNTPRTILVVDDFDDTRLLLRTWLERRGFRVVEAANGIQAINQAEAESPDLIIMDMQMPQLDGLSATRRIRKSLESVPIVAVSAYGADQFRELALAAGCNEYVSTPFEPATLEGIISSLVQR
jgi:CheY-like chemotaxis protein